jgi:chromosome segregation and condensation protein ScpB
MDIEHNTEVLNKHTERGYIAFAHATIVASVYQHLPKQSHEANQAKLPTLRILSYIQTIPRAELEHIPTT